jgi:hypothetical protein
MDQLASPANTDVCHLFPAYRTAMKKIAITSIGVVCVVAAGSMLWITMTPERVATLDTWALFSLLAMFVLPAAIGGLLLRERSARQRHRPRGPSSRKCLHEAATQHHPITRRLHGRPLRDGTKRSPHSMR